MAALSLYEQETIISWNEEEPEATVYTASPKVRARLEKAGLAPERVEGESAWFRVPRKAVRIKAGKTAVYVAGGR